MYLSIIVPVYNSEQSIPILCRELIDFCEVNSFKFEIILVNDCSPDGSLEVIRKIASDEQRIKLLSFTKNFGQISAVMAGLRYSQGEYCLIMDDDLQNPVSEIRKLLNKIKNEHLDFVYGIPKNRKSSRLRKFFSLINDKSAKYLTGKPSEIKITSFLIIRKEIVKEITRYTGPYPYLAGLLFRVTTNGKNLLVDHKQRKYGKSNYNFSKMFSLWMNGVTTFSIKPLRFLIFLGILISSFSLLMICTLIFSMIVGASYDMGWPSLISSICFFGGINLFAIGLVGEYVARNYLSASGHPQSAIREILNFDEVLK